MKSLEQRLPEIKQKRWLSITCLEKKLASCDLCHVYGTFSTTNINRFGPVVNCSFLATGKHNHIFFNKNFPGHVGTLKQCHWIFPQSLENKQKTKSFIIITPPKTRWWQAIGPVLHSWNHALIICLKINKTANFR